MSLSYPLMSRLFSRFLTHVAAGEQLAFHGADAWHRCAATQGTAPLPPGTAATCAVCVVYMCVVYMCVVYMCVVWCVCGCVCVCVCVCVLFHLFAIADHAPR